MADRPTGADADATPISALLSRSLVAFTIEVDNEFEHRMPHHTTRGDTRGGPWLGSLVLWSNCIRLLDEGGMTASDLQAAARTGTNLAGLRRWGYVTFRPEPTRSKQPDPSALVVPTRAALVAKRVWEEVVAEVEERWRGRFGAAAVARIRTALWSVASRADTDLPDGLPILGYGLWSKGGPDQDRFLGPASSPGGTADPDALPLPALVSRTLLLFALDFERRSTVSMAVAANVVRVTDGSPTALGDLPRRAGVSREAVSMAMGIVTRQEIATLEPDPTRRRGKVVRLTDKGLRVRATSATLLAAVEQQWAERYGRRAVTGLRRALTPVVIGTPGAPSPLGAGLRPYPEGWRAGVPTPAVLPDYPMVLHRGGYPDGS